MYPSPHTLRRPREVKLKGRGFLGRSDGHPLEDIILYYLQRDWEFVGMRETTGDLDQLRWGQQDEMGYRKRVCIEMAGIGGHFGDWYGKLVL